jgi:hypothetical protein
MDSLSGLKPYLHLEFLRHTDGSYALDPVRSVGDVERRIHHRTL